MTAPVVDNGGIVDHHYDKQRQMIQSQHSFDLFSFS
jgi:hypothetical protein